MHNFTQLGAELDIPVTVRLITVTLEYPWRKESQHLTYQIPIFPNLLRRRQTPKECIVCAEDKFEIYYDTWPQWQQTCAEFKGPWMCTVLEYPTHDHQRCTHSLDTCRQCVAKHIAQNLNDGRFERIACPQCDRALEYDEIQSLCPEDIFKLHVTHRVPVTLRLTRTCRYDKRVLFHTLGKLPNFRWCLSPHCGSGQVYDDVDRAFPCVRCQDCQFQMCFYHERPWHDGSTCDEYDSLLRYGDPKYRETQETIEEKTKGCPKCNVRIEKGPGCFHMTCKL